MNGRRSNGPLTAEQRAANGDSTSQTELGDRPLVSEARSRPNSRMAPPPAVAGPVTKVRAFDEHRHLPDSVDLRIEEMILRGFEGTDRNAISDAFERELAQLFVERGTPQAISDEIEISDIQSQVLTLPHGLDAQAIGIRLARVIYRGLKR